MLSTTKINTDNEPRKEHRFLANEAVARLALRTAGTYLPLDRDDRPYQWSTTTYCDTSDWKVLRAEKSGHATQLRLREYHRTRPNQAFAGESIFLEMKDDSPDAGMKERYVVPTAEIMGYLRGERAIEAGPDTLVSRMRDLVKIGVRPVVVTQYNRIAYAAPDASVWTTRSRRASVRSSSASPAWSSRSSGSTRCRIGPTSSTATSASTW